MDALDSILLAAWNRISARCRQNRIHALKRSRRRFTGILTRPMREWCLVIRASDTRINPYKAIIDLGPDQGLIMDNPVDYALKHALPHTVTLTGDLIRQMTRPVFIPWPGVNYFKAADTCGREYRNIKNWVRKGVFKINRYREPGFPELKHRGGKRGGRPHVYTPSPIDPNNSTGRPPHPVWGTLWQSLYQNLPENYQLTVRRVPRFKSFRGRGRRRPYFRGWDFLCPGRLNASGEYQGCNRRCTYLYAPQTVWTLPLAISSELGDNWGFDIALPSPSGRGVGGEGTFSSPSPSALEGEGRGEGALSTQNSEPRTSSLRLAGQWFPGLIDHIKENSGGGGRSFACKKCWHIRSACFANPEGWNEFVSTISGGLLYGREVPRPLDVCPIRRLRPQYKTKPRKRSGTGVSTVNIKSNLILRPA